MTDVRWQTAIHEAGHAVIGRALGIACGDVSINPDDDSEGHSITGDVWDTITEWERRGKYRDVRSAYIGRIVTLMAGAEAVSEIVGPVDEHGDDDDRRQIDHMLDYVGGLSEARLRASCRHLVNRHREAIHSLASNLMLAGTISRDDTAAAISGASRLIRAAR